ncbi:MAG TPA: acyltransferase family protein [Solirubrobacterales bacterium]|nr:acyltransferase family protein [Solirubrobacterales bacterium]
MDSGNDKASASSGFRPDIEGLRAIAIVAVLLCHAGIPAFAGGYVGVDVFFVISGFLITRLLLGELGRHGTISIPRFYARRAKRLLPLSALLLGSVGVLSLILLSPLRAVEVSGDIISSATYTANWHFAAQSVDYFAQDIEPSPVLHLWSLAIEEQFYFVWPALMLGVTWYQRRKGRPVRGILLLALAVVFIASLIFGIAYTDSQPAAAYFSTFGRAWELALGGGLALLGGVRLPRGAGVAIGWAGVAAIVYAILAFDANTPFPGVAALVPTLGTAALILAGSSVYRQARAAVATPLSLRPVRYVGRISYSWYLWHWPALVFAAVIWGPLSPLAGCAVVLASLLPTVLGHHFIEDPVRRARGLARMPGRALALGAACMVFAIGVGVALENAQPSFEAAPISEVRGAAALASQKVPQQSASAVRPNPLDARADRSQAFYDGCLVGIAGTNSGHCLYGNPHGTRTLILFGDSHALQYFAPLQKLAKKNNWRLIDLTKAECTPGEVEVQSMVEDREYSQCDAWREKELERIEEAGGRATLVMAGDTAYTAYGPNGEKLSGKANADALEAGYKATLERVQAAGLDAVVIRDTPASVKDIPSCVSEDLNDLEACAFPRPHDWDIEYDVRAAESTPGVHLIDITAEICPSELCRAVIGNALVYRDKAHLTATFARTLSPWIEEGIRESFATTKTGSEGGSKLG